ncbi:DUF423 domain-containing protein [Paenibacillus gansuensis]|uniref:DUF423 domain-containing protein n=1 Tax=Paenibacillus gansuensis TaxID=306542 RepID=A0ABW5PFM2_9BACL
MAKRWIFWGAVCAFLSVAIGAFGAHGLESVLEKNDTRATFETGVHYHIAHSLALVLLGLAADKLGEQRKLLWAGRLMMAGIVLFSGSLYILGITGIKVLGAITPLGGVAFLTAWGLLASAAWKSGSR